MTYHEFLKITPGRTVVIFERLGQPWVERRVIRRITKTGLFSAPLDNINAESVMSVNKHTFIALSQRDQFAIGSDLGRPVAKFQLIPEPTKTKKG